jgi:hypothetical protein
MKTSASVKRLSATAVAFFPLSCRLPRHCLACNRAVLRSCRMARIACVCMCGIGGFTQGRHHAEMAMELLALLADKGIATCEALLSDPDAVNELLQMACQPRLVRTRFSDALAAARSLHACNCARSFPSSGVLEGVHGSNRSILTGVLPGLYGCSYIKNGAILPASAGASRVTIISSFK